MSNETNETPSQGRKVGIARFFELLGRDLWPLYKSGFLCVLGFLPGTALLEAVARNYGCTEFRVSPYGVREGYLMTNLEGEHD